MNSLRSVWSVRWLSSSSSSLRQFPWWSFARLIQQALHVLCPLCRNPKNPSSKVAMTNIFTLSCSILVPPSAFHNDKVEIKEALRLKTEKGDAIIIAKPFWCSADSSYLPTLSVLSLYLISVLIQQSTQQRSILPLLSLISMPFFLFSDTWDGNERSSRPFVRNIGVRFHTSDAFYFLL